MVSPKIVPIKLPRGWAKRAHADELGGIARRIEMRFSAQRKKLVVPLQSSPSSIALARTLKINRLLYEKRLAAMRVAAKIGFEAAGIRSGVQRQAIELFFLIIIRSCMGLPFRIGEGSRIRCSTPCGGSKASTQGRYVSSWIVFWGLWGDCVRD